MGRPHIVVNVLLLAVFCTSAVAAGSAQVAHAAVFAPSHVGHRGTRDGHVRVGSQRDTDSSLSLQNRKIQGSRFL